MVEHRTVAPTVAGSIPVSHPKKPSSFPVQFSQPASRDAASRVSMPLPFAPLEARRVLYGSDERMAGSVSRADFFFLFFPGRVVGLDVVVENLDELGDDLVAFERGEQAAVHVDGGFRLFGGSR